MTKTFKIICLSVLLAGLVLGATVAAAQNRVGIAAVVNDDIITFSDIENRMALFLLGKPGTPPPDVRREIEEHILNLLIDEKLQVQEARALGIVISPEQLAQALAGIAAQNRATPEEFRAGLTGAGVKIETLEDQLRTQLSWAQVVRRRLRPQVIISEKEIDSEIEQRQRSIGRTEYRVAEIFLAVADDAAEAEARRTALELLQMLQQGERFSLLAQKFSQAPGASTGGDLGWIQEGVLDQDIETALKQMQPGQVSPPVRTAKGYHLLFLRDVRRIGEASVVETAALARPAAVAPAAAAQAAAAQKRMLVHLKQIVIPFTAGEPAVLTDVKVNRARTLKNEITSCADMDSKMKDFSSEGTGDLGRGPTDGLPPALRGPAETLPLGTLSEPIRGTNGVAVLMVCDRIEVDGPPAAATPTAQAPATQTPPAPETATAAAEIAATGEGSAKAETPTPAASSEISREEIATRLGQQRLEQMAERYLRDLRATAFIDRRN